MPRLPHIACPQEAQDQLQDEIEARINRYSEESDITVMQVLVVLRCIEEEWRHRWLKHRDRRAKRTKRSKD
jgi:hypothetical protein